jgi:uncharacterized protein (TIGR02271 family)
MTNDLPVNSAATPIDDRGSSARIADSATVTRSEERLDVRVEAVPVERVRLEKYIVTEERTITVTVRREEVRLVREPILDGQPSEAQDGDHDGDDIELWLGAEEIVVTKHVVPVERVRLVRERVVEQREVTETLRKERVDVEQLDSEVR